MGFRKNHLQNSLVSYIPPEQQAPFFYHFFRAWRRETSRVEVIEMKLESGKRFASSSCSYVLRFRSLARKLSNNSFSSRYFLYSFDKKSLIVYEAHTHAHTHRHTYIEVVYIYIHILNPEIRE